MFSDRRIHDENIVSHKTMDSKVILKEGKEKEAENSFQQSVVNGHRPLTIDYLLSMMMFEFVFCLLRQFLDEFFVRKFGDIQFKLRLYEIEYFLVE